MKNLIVIPAYNEEESVEKTLASLQCLPSNYEILVINDGSRDRTGECAQRAKRENKLDIQIINIASNGGIGVAVQAGFIYAKTKGDIIVTSFSLMRTDNMMRSILRPSFLLAKHINSISALGRVS